LLTAEVSALKKRTIYCQHKLDVAFVNFLVTTDQGMNILGFVDISEGWKGGRVV
jgi:hypothetical protein